MLGFKAGVKYAETDDLTFEKKFDLMSNLNTFYVYSDVVEPCLVGPDTKVPLLRIVDKTEKNKTHGLSHIQPFTVRARADEVLRHHRD